MMKTALVTGASSGIGWDVTRVLIQNGYRVVSTVRTTEDAEKLTKNFSTKVSPLILDLSNFDLIDQIPALLKNQFKIEKLDAIINNAGVALAAPFLDQKFSEIEMIFRLNVLAVMKLTQVIIPLLVGSDNPKIINISSISGVSGAPFLAAYASSKHAIEGFSQSLRKEMMLLGIQVVVIGPGSIKTPIWNKGFKIVRDKYHKSVFADAFQKFITFAESEERNALDANVISNLVLQVLKTRNPSFRYAPVPRKWLNWYLPKFIPQSVYNRLAAKALGLNLTKPHNKI